MVWKVYLEYRDSSEAAVNVLKLLPPNELQSVAELQKKKSKMI